MKIKLVHAARIVLGLAFVVFGLNGFLHFLPAPPPPTSGPIAALMGGFIASGYMFALIKGTEVAAGALLLANRFVPLALTILAPIVVNIIAFHAFLAPAGIGPGALVLVLELVLARSYRGAFAPMLRARNVPSVDDVAPAKAASEARA